MFIITKLIEEFNTKLFLKKLNNSSNEDRSTRRKKLFQEKQDYLQNFYNDSVATLNLDSLECPHCKEHGFYLHGSYERHVVVFCVKYCIKITRIICKHCHKTQAILIDDIIPYSQLRFEDILDIIKNKDNSGFELSYVSYILNKYHSIKSFTYRDFCYINRRNNSLRFVPT